jgi:hypothetical protein
MDSLGLNMIRFIDSVPIQWSQRSNRLQVEALRENIRAKVEQSLANGVLEQGPQVMMGLEAFLQIPLVG